MMAKFRFCLIGTPQAPVLEIDVGNISELHHWISRARFIEGRMIRIDGEPTDCPVLIPTNRVQMIFEIAE